MDTQLASSDTSFLDDGLKLLDSGKVLYGIHFLIDALWRFRNATPKDRWCAFLESTLRHHPIMDRVLRDPYTARAFLKPRGYAGDAVMLDYVYGIADPEIHDPIGKGVFSFTTNAGPGKAVRYRREFIAHRIDEVSAQVGAPVDILALAAGHLREASICSTIQQRLFHRCVAFDQDAESLLTVQSAYADAGVETARGTVKDLLARRLEFSGFDVVYAAGLFDYLTDKLAQRLITVMLAALRPGGLMLIPNFLPGIRESIYMEAFMSWLLIYREKEDLLRLVDRNVRSEIADITFHVDPFNTVSYMICRKVP